MKLQPWVPGQKTALCLLGLPVTAAEVAKVQYVSGREAQSAFG